MKIFEFQAPVKGSKIYRKWKCFVGGYDFAGDSKYELMVRAYALAKEEVNRLEKELAEYKE